MNRNFDYRMYGILGEKIWWVAYFAVKTCCTLNAIASYYLGARRCLHMGHRRRLLSHSATHSSWNIWPQGSLRHSSSSVSQVEKHIAQISSGYGWTHGSVAHSVWARGNSCSLEQALARAHNVEIILHAYTTIMAFNDRLFWRSLRSSNTNNSHTLSTSWTERNWRNRYRFWWTEI